MNPDKSRRVAAVVDLGTNAARLALASLDETGRLVSAGRWRELIRLGEGVKATGELSEAAMVRGVETLERFAEIVQREKVTLLDAVGTSALREAANGQDFIARAREAGIPLRVISAEEEARLALAGVRATVANFPDSALVFDIGGGSLELIQTEGRRIARMASVPAGMVFLTERHLTEMPTRSEKVGACEREVRALLDEALSLGLSPQGRPLIGCGGVVALAWFIREGVPAFSGINGTFLDVSEVEHWVSRFAALDRNGRTALPGFEPGREDVALAGLIVVHEILRWAACADFLVSTGGLREGRLMEMLRGET